MLSNIKHPPRLRNNQEQIKPWNADDSNLNNILQASGIYNYQPVNRHTISFNPQADPILQNKSNKPELRGYNFFDNLRKYQKKKAHQLANKRDVNFIQKNKQKLVEDFHSHIYDDRHSNLLTSNLFRNDKTMKNFRQQSPNVQPVNWSQIMYYQTEKTPKKFKHRDIQAFLKFQTSRKESSKIKKPTQQKSQANQDSSVWIQNESFQKILKLKQGIRRRNLKSATSSRQQLEQNSLGKEENELRQSHNLRKKHSRQQQRKRSIPKTSYSSRNQSIMKQLPCQMQIIGNKNVLLIPKKQTVFDLRMIHSSQKNRMKVKVLNIEGNKILSK